MVRLEEGLKQLTDVTNFHIYASHQINVAQAAVFRLQLGLGAAEANVDKILEDEARVQRDCKYEVKPFLDNRAQSLGGYMWAISSIEQEQLQIRCLE